MAPLKKIRRLLKLVEILQSGRAYSTRDLAEMCGVSRRTIFRDLKSLEESGLHVYFDEARQGHWLARTSFLPPTDLTFEETLALLLVAENLGGSGSGVPFQEAARSAVLKLLSNLSGHLQNYLADLSEAVSIRLPAVSELSESEDWYRELMRAIADRRSIRIRYRSLHEERELTTLLSPYRMLFIGRSWYAVGRSSVHRAVRTFNIRRIEHAELTDREFKVPKGFSVERLLGNAWRMIRERGKRTQVTVRFAPLVATNVAEVCWHKTQQLDWQDDGSLDFTVTVDGTSEIFWWILGYGDQAEVLEPVELRKRVAQTARRVARLNR